MRARAVTTDRVIEESGACIITGTVNVNPDMVKQTYEVFFKYVTPFNLYRDRGILTPAENSRDQHMSRIVECEEWATLYGVQSCTRLQLHI